MPKLYTKQGDDGYTSLYDGSKLLKTNVIFDVLGDMDELSSHIGLLSSYVKDSEVLDEIRLIQLILIDISSVLATPNKNKTLQPIKTEYITRLEKEIDDMTNRVRPLTEFLITGISQQDAQANVCRSITRRVERNLLKLENVDKVVNIYINRLSDYFFALSRLLAPYELRVSELRKKYM